MYKINANSKEYQDLEVFHKLAQQFLPFAQKKLEFAKPVVINLVSDVENAKNPLGKTAYYNPSIMEITVFIDQRHVKDILRSMSHELVHHTQNCRGEFKNGINTDPGYAQKDGHMRKMEKEAYLNGQLILRDWEDATKTNKEIFAMVEDQNLEENELEEAAQIEEDTLEEEKEGKCPGCPACEGDGEVSEAGCSAKHENTNENWFKGNKDQLLFERLVKKWAK